MTPLPLVVPDTDDTRRRIIEALAWASGIRRDDIALVSAEARTRWHILADHTLTELRLLSVVHRDGLEGAARLIAARDAMGAPEPQEES